MVHAPNSPFNGPAVVQLDQSNDKEVDNPLIEEDGGEKAYPLAGQLANGAMDPRELTDIIETACAHLTAQDLQDIGTFLETTA